MAAKSGSTIKCEDGFWSQSDFTCEIVDCGTLSDDKYDVTYLNQSTKFESLARVSCNLDRGNYTIRACKQVK